MALLNFEKKVLLLGDAAVGKTSLVRRFVVDRFSDRYLATIGTKTSRKLMNFDFPEHDLHIALQLYVWDVFGQQGMPRAYPMYFKGAEAAIIVCDLTRPFTVASIKQWGSTLNSLCGPTPGVVACNKVDLVGQIAVAEPEAADMAGSVGMTVMKTSAKTGENVEAAFRAIGSLLCAPIVEKLARGALSSKEIAGPERKSSWKPLS